MSDAHQLDPALARTDFERCVIVMKNDQLSWRKMAERLGVSQRIVRDAWNRANVHQRGGQPSRGPVREGGTRGNEELLRGIPLFIPGIPMGGAIRGTRPGDPAWRADADKRVS